MEATLIEEIPLGDSRLRQFVEVPWRLYKGDPFWTPPLRDEYLGSRLLSLPGLLTTALPSAPQGLKTLRREVGGHVEI
jgi:hypothetical protein